MNDKRIRAALAELRRERRHVQSLRSQYRKLVGSRFYALRAIWLAIQGVFGRGKRRNAYIAWNTAGLKDELPCETVVEIDDRAVAALWQSRAATIVDDPIATVVIPVYNHLSDTLRCLQSIAQTWFDSLCVEFIVMDDASGDDTQAVLSQFPGIRYLRNAQNAGFLRSCNFAAKHARGKYICFLNNDTIVREAWLDHLVSTAERDSCVGAVGAKLIYPNGTLQEAGAIIWSNGDGWNYGRGGETSDSRYNFERDVDYCSGAALLVRRTLFEQLGGFDEQFAPAYYEDADLCFAIRRAGYRVVYQPRSEVVHLEGVSSGIDTASGVKRFQERNRAKFQEKWHAALEAQLQHSASNVEAAARRLLPSPRVLFIDSYVPMHDREAGSNRLMHIISYLCNEGCGVTFLPDNYAALQPYTSELQAKGVEVLYHSEGAPALEAALKDALKHVDFVWICRPELFTKYAPMVRAASNAKIIYDTIDLHFVRKQREAQTLGGRDADWREYERMEIAAATSADATIVVSTTEHDILESRGIREIHVVPTIHDRAIDEPRPFEKTSGLLFIGNYNHPPNADAAAWLCAEVMPRVWKLLPDMSVTLLGSNPTKAVQALSSRRIRVPGYVADVAGYFTSARLFVAPLRFGAGLKGKVGQAMAYGLPIVATDIAAEGFGMTDGTNCFIANDAEQFASAIVRAYADKDAWERMARALLEKTSEYSSSSVGANVLRLLSDLERARD